MSRIAVLYEDQLATSKPRAFGPHVLVLACIADRRGVLHEQLAHLERHVDCHPCKGIGRLLSLCREPILRDRHARVIALCDDDEVRAHLKLAATACKTQVRGALATSSDDPQLQTVLLVRNLETVLDAACHVLGRRPGGSKPSPLQRDGILLNLAYQGTPEQRLELLRRVPSFEYFARKLERALQDLGL